MIDKVQRKDCVGCKACGDICPTSAIAFSTDREGFWYPSIDMGKCISCNLCEKDVSCNQTPCCFYKLF